MFKTIKIQIYPNKYQLNIINSTLGCCRFVKNNYIAYNINRYNNGNKFITGTEFNNIINRLKVENSKYSWISYYSEDAIKEAISAEEKAFNTYVRRYNKLPSLLSKKHINRESYYFIDRSYNYYTNNINKVKLPTLGKIRISSGYRLPLESSIFSGRIIREYNKYYVVFIYRKCKPRLLKNDIKLGIDLGVKDYAIIYDGYNSYKVKHYKNDPRYRKLNDKVSKLHSIIQNKVKINSNKKYDKSVIPYRSSNIVRLINKLRRYILILNNIRNDFIKKLCNKILVKFKPKCITIEKLAIKYLLEKDSNHSLHNRIQYSDFYKFKFVLMNKCLEYNVKLRVLDRYYPSTKLCSRCGSKKYMSLSDRIYKCPICGLSIDRDINAAINIYNAKDSDCNIYA